jgi:glycosidase
LNKDWLIKVDANRIGIAKKWFEKFEDLDLIKIEVPSFWESSLGYEFDGWVWYFNHFIIEKPLKKIAIKCDGIDDDATIWLNGKLVGKHIGYSESFYFDITEFVKLGVNKVAILVEDHGGPGGIYKPIRITEYIVPEDLLRTKYADMTARQSERWIKEGIIYEIYPRVFSQDGSFKGIISRLQQLRDFGVTILWLMPINPIGEIKRKGNLGSPYSIMDYYRINPEYGSSSDLKELITRAHELDLKIILDVVLNHSAWDNPLIKNHPEWYSKTKSGEFMPPNLDWSDVADFNYESKELRKYMIEMLKYWITEFDIDGFRCDVSELVPIDFWESARKELDKIKPIFMLSEGTLPEHHLSAFDMTYSWNVYDNFAGILDGTRDPSVILDVVKNESYIFPKNFLRMRFNENHDKQRAAKIFGIDGALITSAVVFTIPGVPLIHNGQEIGETNYASLFEKSKLNWNKISEGNDVFDFYKTLVQLRKNNSSLVYGSFIPVDLGDGILSYIRDDQKNNVLSVFNFSKRVKTIDLNILPDGYKIDSFDIERAIGKKFKFINARMNSSMNKTIELKPLGFILLVGKRN